VQLPPGGVNERSRYHSTPQRAALVLDGHILQGRLQSFWRRPVGQAGLAQPGLDKGGRLVHGLFLFEDGGAALPQRHQRFVRRRLCIVVAFEVPGSFDEHSRFSQCQAEFLVRTVRSVVRRFRSVH